MTFGAFYSLAKLEGLPRARCLGLDILRSDRLGRFCLAESMPEQNINFFRSAECLMRFVDAKAVLFTMRFKAAGLKLNVHGGHIGHVQCCMFPDATTAYVRSLEAQLRQFCPFGFHSPRRVRHHQYFDDDLYGKMRSSHEVMVFDGTRLMVLAGHEASNHVKILPAAETLFYNNRLTIKDFTHGARHCLQRPWEADTLLREIVETIIAGPNSLIQRLRCSPELNRIFVECVEKDLDHLVPEAAKLGTHEQLSSSNRFALAANDTNSSVVPCIRNGWLQDLRHQERRGC